MTEIYIETYRTVPNGPIQMDFALRTCILPNGKEIELTDQQMRVLSRLSTDRVRSIHDIARSVAFEAYPEAVKRSKLDPSTLISEENVYVLISSIRKRIGSQWIVSQKQHGYRLNVG